MLSQTMNKKFDQMMNFIQTNINPNQIHENTKNISTINKQLRMIYHRLDQFGMEKTIILTKVKTNIANMNLTKVWMMHLMKQ